MLYSNTDPEIEGQGRKIEKTDAAGLETVISARVNLKMRVLMECRPGKIRSVDNSMAFSMSL